MVIVVAKISWDVRANLASVTDLPEATLMMARGPEGTHSAKQYDYEAFQVARWALDCFVQSAVPLTHPGGRGNWDALPACIHSTDEGWTYAYLFQRLIEIAALHPAGRAVAILAPEDKLPDAPAQTRAAVTSWRPGNQRLFSFCFRLHREFTRVAVSEVKASWSSVTSGERFECARSLQFKLTSYPVAGFPWDVQADATSTTGLPDGTFMMACGPQGLHSVVQCDYEAFQVARWALDCFMHSAVPLTHPGGRGSWDAMPISIHCTDEGWVYAYVFQRLLDIAAVHPASRNIPILAPDDRLSDAPTTALVAIRSWRPGNQRLFSFCFRLHRALLKTDEVSGGETSWSYVMKGKRCRCASPFNLN